MSSFSRAVASVFAAGMIGGASMLMMVPAGIDLGVAAIYPDPPSVPCKRQTWANSDRSCQRWTVPQGELALAAERLPLRQEPEHQRVAIADLPLAAPADLVPPAPRKTYAPAPAEARTPPQPQQAAPVKYLAETAVDVDTPVVAAAPAPVMDERATAPVTRAKTETPRATRHVALASIAIVSKGRPVVIRPTSQQDVYYYTARARVAANVDATSGPIQR
jgi:hypothetical protein